MNKRSFARELARRALAAGDSTGWFEELYGSAAGDPSLVPWADLTENPNLVEWMRGKKQLGAGQTALVVGCGLGDDAEFLAGNGFSVTAFDISPTAIEWCRRRFPGSQVDYHVADLFTLPDEWRGRFDLVLETYTLQVFPPHKRSGAVRQIAGCVANGGTLLVITRGRDADDDPGQMPWPLLRDEMQLFLDCGLTEVAMDDYIDREKPPVRRFRAEYRR